MKEQILDKLKSVKYPGFNKDIVSYGFVKSVEITDDESANNGAQGASKAAQIVVDIVSDNPQTAAELESEIK